MPFSYNYILKRYLRFNRLFGMVALNLNMIIKAENMRYKKEDLKNTWGIVESKEHARYIAVLADSHDFFCVNYEPAIDNFFYIDDEDLNFLESDLTPIKHGAKEITIPLPPKSDKQELREWVPEIGDEVLLMTGLCTVKSIADKHGVLAVMTKKGFNMLVHKSDIKKPKTPEEELRDDIVWLTIKHMENKSYPIENNAYYLFSDLMGKYNITKKA